MWVGIAARSGDKTWVVEVKALLLSEERLAAKLRTGSPA